MSIKTTSGRDPEVGPRTSNRDDLVTVLLSSWWIVGLFVDAYAHTNLDLEETFFTPWHAIFYSGFVATGSWMVWLVVREAQSKRPSVDMVPRGYGLGIVGLGIFTLGGIGDAIWHTALGVEVGIDALLSPTHILLFIGGVLIVSSPFRGKLRSASYQPAGLGGFLIPLASFTWTVALVSFFFVYLWTAGMDSLPRRFFDPATEAGEIYVTAGIGGIMVTTLILITPVVVLLKRWSVPVGTFTLMFSAINVAMVVAFDLDDSGIIAGVAGGVAADWLTRTLRAGPDRPAAIRLVAFFTPVVMWSVYFLVVGRLPGGLGWPPEIWSGAIFFAGLAGFTIAYLLLDEPLTSPVRANSGSAGRGPA